MGDAGFADTESLQAEAAALFTDVHDARSWPMSRAKCGAIAIYVPVMMAMVPAIVAVLGIQGSGTPVDWTPGLVLVAGVVLFVVAGLWVFVEYGQVAVWGGGIAAGRDGLAIRYGRDRWEFGWPDVEGAALVEMSTWSSERTVTVLEIRFAVAGQAWPFRAIFWGSNDRRLRISPTLFPGTTPLIVAGITAALDEARTPGDEGTERPVLDEGAGRAADLEAQ